MHFPRFKLIKGKKAGARNLVACGILLLVTSLLSVAVIGCYGTISTRIFFIAELDGQRWDGKLTFSLEGPMAYKEVSEEQKKTESMSCALAGYLPRYAYNEYHAVPDPNQQREDGGSYIVTYLSGGPPRALFSGIRFIKERDEKLYINDFKASNAYEFEVEEIPNDDDAYIETGTICFIFDSVNEIDINATLDGRPWEGKVIYSVQGPDKAGSFLSVPLHANNLANGTYTVNYISGAPPGALLRDISPSEVQEVSGGQTTTFTMNFETTGEIEVKATLDGQPWKGGVDCTVQGPDKTEAVIGVPQSRTGLLPGSYTVNYVSGGPPGALLRDISTPEAQEVSGGQTTTFTMNFDYIGDIVVYATLDGQPWEGEIDYTVQGPVTLVGFYVTDTFFAVPIGEYSLVYNSGGPEGAVLDSISPSDGEELAAGAMGIFTLNFISAASITVEATYNGQPWEGEVSYTLEGPVTVSGTAVPQTFSGLPPGTYRIIRNSGHPEGAGFVGIQPSVEEVLSENGTIYFVLEFEDVGEGAGDSDPVF